MHKDDDDEEEDISMFVKNLDTGEKEDVDHVLDDLSMVTIAESKESSDSYVDKSDENNNSSSSGSKGNDSYNLAKGEYVFEEKISPMFTSDAKDSPNDTNVTGNGAQSRSSKRMSIRPKIPDGGRLEFLRISAVGTVADNGKQPYTVYYLDVRCSNANPASWTVYRRYSDFRKASEKLRSQGLAVPILPSRKINNTVNIEVSVMRQQKNELEIWLHNLEETHNSNTGSKDPQKSSAYRSFLSDGANFPPGLLKRIYPESVQDIADSEHKVSDAKETSDFKISLEDFELIRVIGKGSFGKVTLVRKKSDQRVFAMKVLHKTNIVKRKQVEHTRTERRVLGNINHPFIVKLHYAFQTDQKLYFVLDYAAGGELFFHLSRMKKFPEHMTRFYAAEIALALDALHSNGVIYRDLKPENILIDAEGHIKLADFGLAKEGVAEAAQGANSLCGTPEYLSPEVLDRQGHGTAVDWWNLGMVTYEMLTGLPPWYTTDRQKLFERIRRAPLKFPYYVSRNAASFIAGLLNRNPIERLGSHGGGEVCGHSFFDVVDFDAMMMRSVDPPFHPCKPGEDLASSNFEKEFTSMAISLDKSGQRDSNANPYDSDGGRSTNSGDMFENFTFDEESTLDEQSP